MSIIWLSDSGFASTLKEMNEPSAVIRLHTIETPGSPEQFPSIAVPNGMRLTIRAIPLNTNVVYLATSGPDASGRHRITMNPGDALNYYVTNADIFFGDVVTADEGFEITVEGNGTA